MAEKAAIADVLREGGELPAMAVNQNGAVLAQGMIRWEGAQWNATREGMATEVRIDHAGHQFAALLVKPVKVVAGEELQVRFGSTWR